MHTSDRNKIYVTKASGETAPFDPEKIRRTCLRAGADAGLTERVVKEVTAKVYRGITTREILGLVLDLLAVGHPHIAARYDLKGAIMRLGPAGFAFEALLAEVLKEYGYSATVHTIVQGDCVSHEIDVIAAQPHEKLPGLEPELKYYMIECKYHNAPGIFTGIKEVLYTYARFLDVVDGWKAGKCQRFDQPWLATNTKFSADAITYANCKNIKMLGWKYPTGNSLEVMLDEKKLYPVTILRKLDPASLGKLVVARLMLCRDMLKYDIDKLQERTGISQTRLKVLIEEARAIFGRERNANTEG